jgi:hypothetical protein
LLFESRDGRMSTIPGAPHAHKRAAGLMQTEAARILARPVMTVDPSIVTFSAPAGDPPPPEAAVLVHGGGPVNGLNASIDYAQDQPGGWLAATLSDTSVPATLTLSVAGGITRFRRLWRDGHRHITGRGERSDDRGDVHRLGGTAQDRPGPDGHCDAQGQLEGLS